MHDFYYFLYLGRLFIHLNIIIQVSQHSSNFFINLLTTMLTSAFKIKVTYTSHEWQWHYWVCCILTQLTGLLQIINIFSKLENYFAGSWHVFAPFQNFSMYSYGCGKATMYEHANNSCTCMHSTFKPCSLLNYHDLFHLYRVAQK